MAEQVNASSTGTPDSGNARLIWIVVGVIVIVGALAGYAVYSRGKSKTDTADTGTTTSTTKTTATASTSTSSVKISVAEEGKVILTGGFADPTVVKTASGYRMYVNRQSGGSGYSSYTSTDGKTFTKEKDNLISGAATGRAIVTSTGVDFYYPGSQPVKPSDPPANIYKATSSDGVTFKKSTTALVAPSDSSHYLEGPTVFQLPDKTWRMYFNENTTASGNQRDGIIWGASSSDGTTWTRDSVSTIEATTEGSDQPWKQVLHPFVLANPKGGYIMLYNSHSEVYAATSTDGKMWTKIGKVGIHGADVDGYFQADGTIRVYYGDFSEATQGVVYTGVLKVE